MGFSYRDPQCYYKGGKDVLCCIYCVDNIIIWEDYMTYYIGANDEHGQNPFTAGKRTPVMPYLNTPIYENQFNRPTKIKFLWEGEKTWCSAEFRSHLSGTQR